MMRRNSHDSLLDGNSYPSNPPSYYTQMPPVYKQINHHQPLYSNLPPPKQKQGAGYDMMYPSSNQMKSHYHHDQMKYYSPYPDPNPGRNYEHENER